MDYLKPELLNHLASEYALGTLRGRARKRFERVLQQSPQATEEVAFWEQRLAEMSDATPLQTSPASVWAAVQRSTFATRKLGVVHGRQNMPTPEIVQPLKQQRRWPWFAAGFGAAASLVLAFLVGQNNPTLPLLQLPNAAVATQTPAGLPIVVAHLQMPTSSMGWLVSMAPDQRQLNIVAGQDLLQLGRHAIQLWLLSPGKEAIPLGLLPSVADMETSIVLPTGLGDASQLSFGISLEPEGGSPTGKLTHPLLGASRQMDGI